MNGNRKPTMKRKLIGLMFLILAIPAGTLNAVAADQDGGFPGDWLTSYRSARSIGLGGAFTAVADQPLGMLWNPAGMTQLNMNEVFIEQTRLFEDTTVNGLSFVAPGTRFPTLGLSILALRSGDFEKWGENALDDLGTFQEKETAFVLSASHNVASFLSLGANLRIVNQSIDDWSDSGFGFDIGAMARLTDSVRLGAALINIGGPSLELRETNEKYPSQFSSGLAMDMLDNRVLVSAELVHIQNQDLAGRGGAEFLLGKNISLRAGFDKASPAGGFSYQMPNDLRIDYGAIGHELGVTHRFGVSWRFGGFFANSQADPVVFSPLGRNSTTRFHLSSKTRLDPDSWSLDINDRYGKLVRSFGGRGTPPAQILWDGKADTGSQLTDGSYLYSLVVIDPTGRQTRSQTRTIQINTQIQEISVPIQVGSR